MSECLNQHLRKTLTKGRVTISHTPGCPEIPLYLFDPAVLEGPLSHEEAQAVVEAPAYWSFSWASGQVLAQFILAHPAYVADKVVLDFGSGSGLVAIAAAKAGARKVYACDIDLQALDAVKENARLNQVEIETVAELNTQASALDIDIILAADVLYDRDNISLLEFFLTVSDRVLLADSRIKKLPSTDYQQLACIEARTWPDLHEFEEFNQVRIYASPVLPQTRNK